MNKLLVGSVLRLIKDHGQTTTFTSVTVGSYDPAFSEMVSGSKEEYSIKAYFAEFDIMNIGSVVEGSRRVLMPTVDSSGNSIPTPKQGDKLLGVSGDTVVVDEVQKIYSGDIPVCYICKATE